jgi:hypothetical protein
MSKINIIKSQNNWGILIGGLEIRRLCLDFSLILELWEQDNVLTIRIESPFTLSGATGNYNVDPQKVESIGPALQLLFKTASTLQILENGTLEMVLTDSSCVRVKSETDFEAWEVNSDKGLKIVCMPGGDIAIWQPNS